MTDREAYIALNQMEGLGPIKVRALIDMLGSPQAVFEVEGNALQQVRGIGQKLCASILSQRGEIDPQAEIEQAAELGIRILTPLDGEYPEVLKTIHDPPLALYVRGSFLPGDEHMLGIVGSRKATHYGLNIADRLAYQCGSLGLSAGANRIRDCERVGARNRHRRPSGRVEGKRAHYRGAWCSDRSTLSARERRAGRCDCSQRRGDQRIPARAARRPADISVPQPDYQRAFDGRNCGGSRL